MIAGGIIAGHGRVMKFRGPSIGKPFSPGMNNYRTLPRYPVTVAGGNVFTGDRPTKLLKKASLL